MRRGVIAVHHPKDPTRPTVIRLENFDPAVHRVWEEAAPAGPPPTPAPVPAEPDRWFPVEPDEECG